MQYTPAITVLTALTCAIAVAQLAWFRKNTWLTAPTPRLVWCILSSAVVALSNGLQALLSPGSADYYDGVGTLFSCIWVYNYLLLLLFHFQPLGGGGKQEMLQAAGRVLEQAKLPVRSYKPPCCVLFTCATKYTPNETWLRGAFWRVELYIAGTVLLNTIKNTLSIEGHASLNEDCAVEYSGTYSTLITVLTLLVLFLGLSGILELNKVLQKLVVPARRDLIALRHRLFLFVQTFTAVQSQLIFGMLVPMTMTKCETKRLAQLVLAAEYLLVQVAAHKAFVPRFQWGWSRGGLPKPQQVLMQEMNLAGSETRIPASEDQNAEMFDFLVPVEEMASELAPGRESTRAVQTAV